MKENRLYLYPCIFFCLMMLNGCYDNDSVSGDDPSSYTDTTYTVAVILQLDQYNAETAHRVADWALQNIKDSQEGLSRRISLQLEWYDENTLNLDSLALKLRQRKDITAVIGASTSTHTDILANRFRGTRKVLISPSATSAELIRSYAGYHFFWDLAESDITQCEVLLTRAINNGAKSVSLLASTSIYGQTFVDWFAFQATELGIKVGDVYFYDDDAEGANLKNKLAQAFANEHDALICAPSDMTGVRTILEARKKAGGNSPWLLFSDVAYTPEMLDVDSLSEYAEGITTCSDPESGFDIAYRVHTGSSPSGNESQIYDAFMLTAAAITELDSKTASTMNNALVDVVRTTDDSGNRLPALQIFGGGGLHQLMKGLRENGQRYNIQGASGTLDFDAELQTNVVKSIYSHWMIYNKRFVSLNYLSSDGSRRTESSLAAWNWIPTVTQHFDESATFSYPALNSNWALLIAGSDGWTNFRHQADVLNMYQILKYYGYRDDHIVLIQQDDLANNPENPNQGQVLRYDSVNLYVDVHTDYHLSDIQADDIEKILTGQKSDSLPAVINAGPNDNVLVFWSGHGVEGAMKMGNRADKDCFTTARMAHLLHTMHNENRYRKMLWLIETCYSASVAVAAESEEIPGVMMMTSAGALEPSKADIKIDGVYRTNRFTEYLTSAIKTNPDICYRDLYYYLSKYTIGSHVTVLNATRFDNLFKTSPREFLQPVSQ